MTLEEGLRSRIAAVATTAAVLLPVFALFEINYPHLAPQSQLAIFAGLGLTICILGGRRKLGERSALAALGDVLLAALAIAVCAWVVVQTEPLFENFWLLGSSQGNRAGGGVIDDLAREKPAGSAAGLKTLCSGERLQQQHR